MRRLIRGGRGRLGCALSLGLGGVAGASGHVQMNAPNGGETFAVGEVVTIEWQVQIEHETQNWDLWYSTTGPDGPWTAIVMNLPPGDISGGAIHTFEWTVPALAGQSGWVRVRQDNTPTDDDYYDVSNDSFAIVAGDMPGDANCDGIVSVTDIAPFVLALTNPTGYAAQFPDCDVLQADMTGDGFVTVSDIAPFVALLAQ